jgi:hypothetical protein
MPPVFQTLITLAVRVLLSLLFLRKMSLAVRNNLAHVVNVILLVLARILLGVLLQNCDDLASRFVTNGFAATVIFRPWWW